MIPTRSLILAFAIVPVLDASRAGAQAPSKPAPNPAVKRAADLITPADLLRDVTHLASDPLLGRASVTRDFKVSPGFDSAAAYISRRLKQLGVKPGGDNGTYLRHYNLRRSTLDTAATYAWVDTRDKTEPGTVSGSRIGMRYRTDYVVRSYNTTGPTEGQVVYVGNGQRSADGSADPFAGLDVRGKWLLAHPGPPAAPGVLRGDYVGIEEEARSRGAIGILIIERTPSPAPAGSAAPPPAPGRGGGVPTVRDITPTAGRSYAPFPLPRVALQPAAVRALLEGERVTFDDIQSDAWKTKGIALSERRLFRIDIKGINESTIQHYNVVGIIPGSDARLKAEYISIASHLDGAVGNGVANGDSIYNAADDNATGSAGNMAIAKALMSGPRPKRSVLLVWDSGEETGLWGSRTMAYSPTADSIVAHFNVDMIGRSDPNGDGATGDDALSGSDEVYVSGPGVLSSHIDRVLERVSRDYNFIAFDRQFENGNSQFFYPRTDASPYFERGIPFIEFFSGLHADYHRQSDDVAKLDPVKMARVSKAVYATAWMLADDPTRPRIDKPIPAHLPFIKPRK